MTKTLAAILLTTPSILLLGLTACSSPPRSERSGMERADAPRNLEELVQRWQAGGGNNITYDAETARVLRITPAPVADRLETESPADDDRWTRAALEAEGFEIVPVGPPHLHVLQIVRRRAG